MMLVGIPVSALLIGYLVGSWPSGSTKTSKPHTTSSLKSAEDTQEVTYSQYKELINKHQITAALVVPEKNQVSFYQSKKEETFMVLLPPNNSLQAADQLAASGADVAVSQPAPNPSLLSKAFHFFMPVNLNGAGQAEGSISIWRSLLMLLGIFILGWFIWNVIQGYRLAGKEEPRPKVKAQGGPGELRGDVYVEEAPSTRFSDVAGCDEVVEELQEFVCFLQSAEDYHAVGARIPSGVVLHGPPGTGKTLLARAMAGEAGVPFFAVSGSEFVEKYVGVGASRVRELFQKAREQEEGAVIFIDEIDAIGRSRSNSDIVGNREHDQTLNELLAQMDGFQKEQQIVVIGATNRLDVLDAALLRPGRLSRHIPVDLPAEKGRLDILKLYAKNKPLQPEVNLEELAQTSGGMSGADLEDMLNEAAIMAAREKRRLISQNDLVEGQLRAIAGPAKKDNHFSEEEQEVVANHEAGHVLTSELCREHEKAQRTSIRPRGRAGGLAMYGQKDRGLHSPQLLFEKLVCLLGGRAAEWVVYGSVSSGAANDLQRANQLARQAVEELGFAPQAGQISASSSRGLSDRTREVMDREVERMVAEAYGEAVRLLSDNKQALQRLSDALLRNRDLDRMQIIEAISGPLGKLPDPQVCTVAALGPNLVPVLHQNEDTN